MSERGSAVRIFRVSSRSDDNTPSWVVDVLLGMAVALALALIITTNEGGTRPTDIVAYLFAVGFGALLLLRRRMPRATLILSVLGMFAYYTLEYPPIGVAIPIVAALYSAAEAGLMLWSVGTSVIVFAVSMFFRVLDGREALGSLLGYESVSNIALFSAAITLGYSIRARRIRTVQQAEIVRLTEAQLAREKELQMQTEHEHISRELHDTVGHTLSVISVQTGVAAEAIGRDDPAAREALDHIRSASTRSLRDLRTMVRLLRSTTDRDETRRIYSLSAIQEVVDAAQRAGLEITTDITVESAELPATVDVTAYRVIQESITNIVRHAHATHAQVKAALSDDHLCLTITDNGKGPLGDDHRTGYGIVGMTERVRLLGGSLKTRHIPHEGFTVEAMIPARLS